MDMRSVIRSLTRKCPFLCRPLSLALRAKDAVLHGPMHEEMRRCIASFCTPEQQGDRRYIRRLERDMWYSYIRYACRFREYFLFHFSSLSNEGRRQFVMDETRVVLAFQMGSEDSRDIFRDKARCYDQFRPFYKREGLKVDAGTSFDEFSAFVAAHPRLIVKPRDGSFGKGVTVLDAGAPERPLPELFRQLQNLDLHTPTRRKKLGPPHLGAFLEEPIVQCEAMARFHPQSVNTVRAATFVKDGTPHILFTFLKIGRGDSIVDNGGAGGLLCAIDTDTGIVVSPGTSEALETFLVHPDTGAQIIGARIPRWEEMRALACTMALSFPAFPYISWDLALTDGGWVLVEANNAGQFVGPQLTTQRGIRPLLSQYFDLT